MQKPLKKTILLTDASPDRSAITRFSARSGARSESGEVKATELDLDVQAIAHTGNIADKSRISSFEIGFNYENP